MTTTTSAMHRDSEQRSTQSRDQRSVGAILIDAGLLRPEDAERVLRAQKEHGLRFGEAAVKLGLITEKDLQKALSTHFDFPYLTPGQTDVSKELVAAYDPFSPQVETLRALRTQLVLRWFNDENPRKAASIVSADRGEGRSTMAANLAIVFSQLGEHTLLIDADLRHARQHTLFNLPNAAGLSSVLAERADLGAIQRVPGFNDLSLLTAGPTPPNPQELLSRHTFRQLLDEVSRIYDVVLVDTTAFAVGAEAQIVAAQTRGAMAVVRGGQTRSADFNKLVGSLRVAGSTVIGSVLNNF